MEKMFRTMLLAVMMVAFGTAASAQKTERQKRTKFTI